MAAGQSTISRGRLVGWLALVVTLSALAYAGRFSETTPDRDVLYRYSSALAAAIQYALMLAVLLWITRGLARREVFALRRPASWKRAALVSGGVLLGIYAVAAALEPILQGGKEQGLTPEAWDPERALPYAVNFLAVAGLAPVVEELTFRGLGFAAVRPFYGTVAAVAATAVLFGLAHGLVAALPVLVVFGIGLGIVRATTDSVVPCIVLHVLFNAIALVAAVTVGT